MSSDNVELNSLVSVSSMPLPKQMPWPLQAFAPTAGKPVWSALRDSPCLSSPTTQAHDDQTEFMHCKLSQEASGMKPIVPFHLFAPLSGEHRVLPGSDAHLIVGPPFLTSQIECVPMCGMVLDVCTDSSFTMCTKISEAIIYQLKVSCAGAMPLNSS